MSQLSARAPALYSQTSAPVISQATSPVPAGPLVQSPVQSSSLVSSITAGMFELTASKLLTSPDKVKTTLPPYFGASSVGATASFWVGSSPGLVGVVGVVGVVGIVGVAAGPQAAISRDKTIRTLTTSHRIFFILFPPCNLPAL